MKNLFAGTLIAGLIFAFCSARSTGACLAAGALATYLLMQLGPRSIVEKIGALMTVALIAWLAGPRAATRGDSLFGYLFCWALASTALAFYLHPRSE